MEDTFNTLLGAILTDYQIVKLDGQTNEKYTLSFQCKLNGEGYDEKCDKFIQDFSNKTASNWVVEKTLREGQRFEFRKRYLCHLSIKNKVQNKKKGETRNYNCHANISIKFLKQTDYTLKKSKILREGLHVLIDINYLHSHRLHVAQAYNLLRCSNDVKTLFVSYFESGMCPAAAKTFHEMELAQNDDIGVVECLANAQKNPTESQVNYLYKKWRNDRYGERDVSSATEILKKRQAELKEGELYIKEDPTIVIVITPIMKRLFLAGFANEILFIDSSSSCDQSNTSVTFFFVPTKVGAVPVAVAFHTSQSEINYLLVFNAVKEALQKNTEVIFSPPVIMTDDSTAMRNALKVVFPNSTFLLCIFHVTQALWRWLWLKDNNVPKEHRKCIMNMFRDILFSITEENAEDCFTKMEEHNAVNTNVKLMKHLGDLWARRKEWALAFRRFTLNRGHNTNNYCEASIRIFKDVVLQRCKAFNMCALADFVLKTFELYHRKRLLHFANSRSRRMTLDYQNFFERSKKITEIIQVDEKTFNVQSERSSEYYVVDSEIGFCTCPSGSGGRFCKHLLAVEKKYSIMFKSSLLLSESDRRQLAYLALGKEVPQSFFEDINASDDDKEGSLNEQTTDQDTSEQVELRATSQFNMPIDQIGIDNYNNLIHKINDQFERIGEVLQSDVNTSNIPQLQKFATVLETLQTPSQIISFMCLKTAGRRSRKIKVQPTSISRRKARGISGGRIQAGRPTNLERLNSKKRPHKIAFNISNNVPCAKKH